MGKDRRTQLSSLLASRSLVLFSHFDSFLRARCPRSKERQWPNNERAIRAYDGRECLPWKMLTAHGVNDRHTLLSCWLQPMPG